MNMRMFAHLLLFGSLGLLAACQCAAPRQETLAATPTTSTDPCLGAMEPVELNADLGASYCYRNEIPVRAMTATKNWANYCGVRLESSFGPVAPCNAPRMIQDNDRVVVLSDRIQVFHEGDNSAYSVAQIEGRFPSLDNQIWIRAHDAIHKTTLFVYLLDWRVASKEYQKHYFVQEFGDGESDVCKKEMPAMGAMIPIGAQKKCGAFNSTTPSNEVSTKLYNAIFSSHQILQTGVGDGPEHKPLGILEKKPE